MRHQTKDPIKGEDGILENENCLPKVPLDRKIDWHAFNKWVEAQDAHEEGLGKTSEAE